MEKFDIFRLDGYALRIFLTVCETGSVSRAAHIHGLNQSTVSYTLDKLRSAIGDPLFVKSGRGIVPTEKSLSIKIRVQEILANIEGMLSSADYDPSMDSNPVRIGIATPSLLGPIRNLYLTLRDALPKLELVIRNIAPRESLITMLDSGEIDIGIAISGLNYPVTLNHQSFGEDPLVVFYDPTRRGPVHSIDEYVAARHAVVGFGGTTPSVVETELAKVGVARTIEFRAPNTTLLGEFIRGTDLIATMPRTLADEVWSDFEWCVPPMEMPTVKQELVWHRRYDHSGRNIWIREKILEARKG